MASSLRIRTAIILIFSVFTVLFLVFLFFYVKRGFQQTRTEISEDVMVEKITDIGKLELVKYTMKDVLEKKELRLILPDKRILFVAAGEVTGCIDLRKVGKEDIVKSSADSVTVYLPQPEICYVKLDHKRSKVYDVSGAWFPADTKEMVEGIYKLAEQRILQNAKEMDILGKTRQNAFVIFKPMLENISGKKVGIKFK
ncbi:uncharacterized protein DUF4230 [Arcticibacter tournemirensis]|uniref:DUF4230 domain-containing protein n=1 Tax=Arcticibacter tournemirensis TaxID=699437 RepID=A0A4Q0MGG5_9SPHI|nr:DUF4230 domain-containing protein [Arcticibacter tournemirensis]KAA8483576.1 DUF4230 domain-containing protein [Arcticibacter tournemirensis]RXF72570.1 DUF4230 domain-containing protein [Arcticibacter tournemirensis]TQM51473.1 uncharacterized protein DUF4230 [Arcticibacter tournemirensis]